MKSLTALLGMLAVACFLQASSALAAPSETYVSASGTDAGACAQNSPCRTLQFAHNQVATNGSIYILSSGNFGPLNITKSVDVVAEGVEAIVSGSVPACGAICVAGAGAVVSLRGLTIDLHSSPGAAIGVGVVFGKSLQIQNCRITRVRPAAGSAGVAIALLGGSLEVNISNSTISQNFGSPGLSVQAGVGSLGVKITLVAVLFEDNSVGIAATSQAGTGKMTVAVKDSVITGHTQYGVRLQSTGGPPVTVMLDRTVLANNDLGVLANGAGSTAWLNDSTLTGHAVALAAVGGGAIASYGNNRFAGNNSDGPPPSVIAMK